MKKRIGGMNSSSTEIKDTRKFGIVSLLFFGILCGIGIWRQKPIPIYLFGMLAVLGFSFILMPRALKPVHETWLKGAQFIGLVVTTIAMAFAYYLIITPAALIKRVFGGRPIPLSPDPQATTYWVTKDEPGQPKERFHKRFYL